MRYTRYEYKKSGKIKFVLSVVLIAGVSIAAGMYGSKIIFNNNPNNMVNQVKTEKTINQNTAVETNGKRIIAIQCGYYANYDNAQSALGLIPGGYNSFIVQDEDKYRVIAGIFNYDEGIKKIDELTSQGVSNTKIEFLIPEDTNDNKTVLEIMDGFLKITSKLSDTSVKSIKTSDYKTWAYNVLKENGSENLECFQSMNTYIGNIPDEIDNNNSKESIKNAYEIVKKYKIVK